MMFDLWVVLAGLVVAMIAVGGCAVVRAHAAPPRRRRARLRVAVHRSAGGR